MRNPAQRSSSLPFPASPSRNALRRRLAPFVLLVILLLLWQLVTALQLYPAFIIPPPGAVLAKFAAVAMDGSLLRHSLVTLQAVLAGLAVGVSVGIVLGYLIAHSSLLEDSLAPLIIGLQATPIVAWAPLLVIWLAAD